MTIDLYAAGYCFDNGKPAQRAAAGMVLLTGDGRRREIVHPLGAVTAPQAELNAAMGALLAVRPEFHGEPITLYTSQYVARALERSESGYVVEPKSNVQLVRRLRDLVSDYPQLAVVAAKDENTASAVALAKSGAQDQAAVDTGTQRQE